MDTTLKHLDEQIVARYAKEPVRLPAELRERIASDWTGPPILLYALADLDENLRLAETWVVLGPRDLTVARVGAGGACEVRSVARDRVTAVREAPGLSATTLTVLGEPGDPPLAVLRYTHRQRRGFENLRFVLEERLAGRDVPPADADRE